MKKVNTKAPKVASPDKKKPNYMRESLHSVTSKNGMSKKTLSK